ncbi:hypothetical protein, partial [Corallococcus praedator]|uniref:hypothetical protein n=1 Tax=Corallococcus praedator TaxID=2316724 RepID=UPI0013150EFC
DLLVRDGQSLSTADLLKLKALKKPQALVLPPYEKEGETSALSLDKFGMKDVSKIGAKAANVAELRRLIPAHTIQEGLALPLAAFHRFLKTAKTNDGAEFLPRYQETLRKLLLPEIRLSETIVLLTELRTLI